MDIGGDSAGEARGHLGEISTRGGPCVSATKGQISRCTHALMHSCRLQVIIVKAIHSPVVGVHAAALALQEVFSKYDDGVMARLGTRQHLKAQLTYRPCVEYEV